MREGFIDQKLSKKNQKLPDIVSCVKISVISWPVHDHSPTWHQVKAFGFCILEVMKCHQRTWFIRHGFHPLLINYERGGVVLFSAHTTHAVVEVGTTHAILLTQFGQNHAGFLWVTPLGVTVGVIIFLYTTSRSMLTEKQVLNVHLERK